MKLVKQITASVLAAVTLCGLWSCNEDEDQLSKAVLASATTLSFEAQNASEKLITVYSDANWISEVPEWVTISPAQGGAGTTEVTVSVTDNMRDGAEDNPRKATLVFKGSTLASRAEVIISQSGDKYRDVKDYKRSEIAALADESVVSIPDVIVVAVTTDGFIVSDAENSGNAYIINSTPVSVGDRLSLRGTKGTDTQSLAIVECDELEILSTGGTVTYPTAEDITSKVDSYNPKDRTYISVDGVLSGSNISHLAAVEQQQKGRVFRVLTGWDHVDTHHAPALGVQGDVPHTVQVLPPVAALQHSRHRQSSFMKAMWG